MVCAVLTTQINKIKNSSLPELLLYVMAPACFIYALYIAAKYAEQPPLDLFAFRQSQTALTAYWLMKDGFSFAYETPVGGPPWSIPFEFPIYQYIVALISKASGWSLTVTGRMVSFAFLALCAIPAKSIVKNLGMSRSTFLVFIALLFSSPFYLYWGRAFMIETAALFFTIASIKYFVDIIQSRNSYLNELLFVLFITLAMLQKVTTGLPVLALMCLIYVYLNLKASPSFREFIFGKRAVSALIYFGFPLAIGVAWTEYSDYIKSFNQLGAGLTSNALGDWNWGTWSQRFSYPLYHDVIWQRIFRDNLCGFLGLFILIAAFFSKAKREIKFVILISLILGALPLYLFTNLQLVHNYYQSASLIFVLFALAASIGHMLDGNFAKQVLAVAFTFIFVCLHFVDFSLNYRIIAAPYNYANSLPYSISQVLKKEVPEGKYFVAFGNDWSSTMSFLSERKSFTVPPWFKAYDEIVRNPEKFVPERDLGAVVLCPVVKSPTVGDLIRWSSAGRLWKIGQVHECYVVTPETPLPVATPIFATHGCRSHIEFVGERTIGNDKVSSISGWTSTANETYSATDKIYVSLVKKGSEPVFLEALQVDDGSAERASSASATDTYRGFSRVFSENISAGDYVIQVARTHNGHLDLCGQ
jgi:hypothetical protein